MTNRLLVIGECMIELSAESETTCSVGFAGDTFNTAWYARQLTRAESLEVAYFTAVGDDKMSGRMLEFMHHAGIETHVVTIGGASPGLYMIHLDGGERSFQYWRSASAARHLADDLDRLPTVSPGDTVYFSGITIAILPEHRRSAFLKRISELRATGAKAVFDPNLRPHLWPDQESMVSWITRSAEVSSIVLPSFEDEAVHFGDESPEATVERYLDSGASLVVVKNGPGPVYVREAGGDQFTVTPAAIDHVVDTTAAGDAFNAAFLVGYLEQQRLREAVLAGCTLARHVVGQKGALVSVSYTD